ncbi:MAG: thioesterase family protein [Alphaproteobacteria bacterium]
MEAYFTLDGDQAMPSVHCAGPWDPTMLHGAAPAALIACLADRIPAPQPMRVARLTIELKRPVPIAPLTIRQWVTRQGRNIQTIAITLSAGEKDVVDAFVLKVADRPLDLPEAARLPVARHVSRADAAVAEEFHKVEGFNSTVEFRDVPPLGGAGIGAQGRACWFHVKRPFVEGMEPTPLMRAAASADYCNALGVPLDFKDWTYINADLTVHFARVPVGEWMLLDGEAMVGPDGRGLAYGSLWDEHGAFGRAIQSLVIAPR